MTTDLKTIFEKYRYDRSIEAKSKTWFWIQQQSFAVGRHRVNEKNLFSEQKTVSDILPGKLYMFYYDPKYKDSLPYYDRFPLVFPFKAVKGGFLGLNMHYLPYFFRVELMSRLMTYATNTKLDKNTKLKYSWQTISGISRFKKAEPCVKHYLKSHIQSTFIEIPASDWHTAMMLPVERFVGSSKSTVWGNSIKP